MAEAPELRVSDAERDHVGDVLRRAAGEGRLEPDELEERLTAAYGARTRGELDALLVDLPPAGPVPAAPLPLVDRVRERASDLWPFLLPSIICVAIWAMTGAGSFWPMWVMLGTGIAALKVLAGGDDEDELPGPADQGLPRPPSPPGLP